MQDRLIKRSPSLSFQQKQLMLHDQIHHALRTERYSPWMQKSYIRLEKVEPIHKMDMELEIIYDKR